MGTTVRFHQSTKDSRRPTSVSVVFELAGFWRGWNIPVSPTSVSVVFELAGLWRGWNIPVSPTSVSVVFELAGLWGDEIIPIYLKSVSLLFKLKGFQLEAPDVLKSKNTNTSYAALAGSFSLKKLLAAHHWFAIEHKWHGGLRRCGLALFCKDRAN